MRLERKIDAVKENKPSELHDARHKFGFGVGMANKNPVSVAQISVASNVILQDTEKSVASPLPLICAIEPELVDHGQLRGIGINAKYVPKPMRGHRGHSSTLLRLHRRRSRRYRRNRTSEHSVH